MRVLGYEYFTDSTDGGTTWSAPVRVTPDTDNAMHNVEVIGGPAGTAYVAWQTSAPSQGYATYLQAFSTATGLVGTPMQISTSYGNPSVWPGDTFGRVASRRNRWPRQPQLHEPEYPGAYLINAATGAILSTLPTGPSRVFGQPIFAQGTLFVATETDGLYNFAP